MEGLSAGCKICLEVSSLGSSIVHHSWAIGRTRIFVLVPSISLCTSLTTSPSFRRDECNLDEVSRLQILRLFFRPIRRSSTALDSPNRMRSIIVTDLSVRTRPRVETRRPMDIPWDSEFQSRLKPFGALVVWKSQHGQLTFQIVKAL